jgi:two-component system, NarL family, nitrate/nitrite response regulator NarL
MADDLRILIVADNLLARAGLAALLEPHGSIVGQISGGSEMLEDVDIYRADVLLADLGWTPETMLAQLAPLTDGALPVLGLLADDDDAAAALAGLSVFPVYGLLRRESSPERMAMAMQAAVDGLIVLDPVYKGALAHNLLPVPGIPPEALTRREIEVLQLLATGQTNKAIARKLGITDHTVKFHVNAIMTKLGAQSRTDAVIRATRSGLILL